MNQVLLYTNLYSLLFYKLVKKFSVAVPLSTTTSVFISFPKTVPQVVFKFNFGGIVFLGISGFVCAASPSIHKNLDEVLPHCQKDMVLNKTLYLFKSFHSKILNESARACGSHPNISTCKI